MGSVCDATEEVVDYLNAAGDKVGLIKVRLYRPFVAKYLLDVIPDTVKSISVLDRTKEPGSIGEPLYLDVLAALQGSKFGMVPVYTGRYGLGSKDTTPGDIVAVYRNMETDEPKRRFTIGIVDDVTHLSLDVKEILTQLLLVQALVSSGVLVLTVQLVQIRTPLRLSATTQICMHKVTSHMTLRSLAVLQFLTFVSDISQLNQLTISVRQTS